MVAPLPSAAAGPLCCPACGARIKSTGAARNQRVRCPKCREVVVLKSKAEAEPAQIAAQFAEETARLKKRIETLEARVAELEKAVAACMAAAASHEMDEAGPEPPDDYSPEQAGRLRRNLSALRAHRITIQYPVGDDAALRCAQWFKGVFERARWAVRGPEEAPAGCARRGISFYASLPVSREVAATYYALKKAGFELQPEFDAELKSNEERLIISAPEQPPDEPLGFIEEELLREEMTYATAI